MSKFQRVSKCFKNKTQFDQNPSWQSFLNEGSLTFQAPDDPIDQPSAENQLQVKVAKDDFSKVAKGDLFGEPKKSRRTKEDDF